MNHREAVHTCWDVRICHSMELLHRTAEALAAPGLLGLRHPVEHRAVEAEREVCASNACIVPGLCVGGSTAFCNVYQARGSIVPFVAPVWENMRNVDSKEVFKWE
jgi:hypothetical protein